MTSLGEILGHIDALEAKLAEAIGRFSIRFAHLEGHLNWAIGCLLGTTEARGRITTAAIQSVSTRLDIYAALVSGLKMQDDVRARLKECEAAIGDLNAYRNRLLHNQWGSISLSDLTTWSKVWTETRRRKSERKHASFTVDEINAKAAECLTCVIRLMDGIKVYQEGGALKDF